MTNLSDTNEVSIHLGNVLMMLAELDDGDRCVAFEKALEFYNENNPTLQIEPVEGYKSFLVQETPLSRIAEKHPLWEIQSRFEKQADNGFPIEDYDQISESLQYFQDLHPQFEHGSILANRVAAMLAVEAMEKWERMEWEKE